MPKGFVLAGSIPVASRPIQRAHIMTTTAPTQNFVQAARERVAEVVVGQDVGVPGIAKTLLVNAAGLTLCKAPRNSITNRQTRRVTDRAAMGANYEMKYL